MEKDGTNFQQETHTRANISTENRGVVESTFGETGRPTLENLRKERSTEKGHGQKESLPSNALLLVITRMIRSTGRENSNGLQEIHMKGTMKTMNGMAMEP